MGCTPSVAPNDGLLDACKMNEWSKVPKFLNKGADPNIVDTEGEHGYVPLMWAASEGHVPTLQLLVSKGGKINTPDRQGETPLFKAVRNKRTDAVKWMVSAEGGADVHHKKNNGTIAISIAANNGHQEIQDALKAAGSADAVRD
eukprot:NODE_7044_length_608_cov_97.958420_g7021_i0.p1 GENE.NODE_7044_length_608_cov_97.958420_g7021_i0~~NODE_7044_length_608_cov_97.958420_g7021_i0.p1  ORF type:complete len:167 (+),score=19.65 NODE_7044_length_608_cov_97.958420_g7021_i0:71-502(+)